jgi:predicted permease
MKTLLFPHRFKLVGWIIFAITAAIGAYILFTDNTDSYLLNNIAIIGTCIGAILATCSREKVEDEMTEQIRLSSLLVALYINYAILIVCSLLIYDLDFLQVMLYNMFTILLIFMAVYHWKIWRTKKGVEDEQ